MKPVVMAALGVTLGLSGCASMNQSAHQVLVRDPAVGHYAPPVAASVHASRQWVYAVMSDRVYEVARVRSFEDRRKSLPSDLARSTDGNACPDAALPPIPSEWSRWPDFPSAALQAVMRKKGLFLMVFERTAAPREIVVVFEGTNFAEMPDWESNFRWFLRFLPGIEDQYTLTARNVSDEFFDYIRSRPERFRVAETDPVLRNAAGEPIRIVSTGHSLGGGLAQHFAYTFKQANRHATGPRVSEVFAFDPSPVTGWSTSEDPPRTHNATGLVINRIFEHGEILAYVRLLTSRLAVTVQNPAIWEYRYNVDPGGNFVGNHSMRRLACGLAHAAGVKAAPPPSPR